MPTAPSLISYSETASWQTAGATKTITIPSFVANDVVIVAGLTEGAASESIATPTASGLTFSAVVTHTAASNCAAAIFKATAAGSGTSVVVTAAVSNARWGAGAWVWRGSTGVGNSASGFSTPRTVSLTPVQADSAMVWIVGDWAANVTLQTITPTPSNTRQRFNLSGAYDGYAADLIDQVSAGAVSYGLTSTGGGPFSIIAVEIKGTAGGTTFSDSLAFGVQNATTQDALVTFNAAVALGASAGTSDSTLATIVAASSLGAILGTADAVSAQVRVANAFGISAGLADSVLAQFSTSAAAGIQAGSAATVTAQIADSLLLGIILGTSSTTGTIFANALNLGVSAGTLMAVVAQMFPNLALGEASGMSASAQAQMAAALILGARLGLIDSATGGNPGQLFALLRTLMGVGL